MEELSSAIGVSRPTLSKYFHDTHSVRRSTRERIEQALTGVEYLPNFFATRMNRRSTQIIGVVVPYLNDQFFTSLLEAIEREALDRGYTVFIQSAHGDPELESAHFRSLRAMSADGIIVAPIGHASSTETLAQLIEDTPLVFVDSRIEGSFEGVDFVGTNNRQSISLMVEYLCRSGSAPAYLGMPRTNSNSHEREEAYLMSAAQLGFEPRIIPVDNTSSIWNFEEAAFETMNRHFGRGEFVDSTILCANDRLAIGVIRAANRHHVAPADPSRARRFRVAGHDDHPLSAYVCPALTTVSRSTEEMGKAAVDQIIDQIETGRRRGTGMTRIFDAELRLRESA